MELLRVVTYSDRLFSDTVASEPPTLLCGHRAGLDWNAFPRLSLVPCSHSPGKVAQHKGTGQVCTHVHAWNVCACAREKGVHLWMDAHGAGTCCVTATVYLQLVLC